jgi:hypothetical protein
MALIVALIGGSVNPKSSYRVRQWYAEGEQVRTVDSMIDWLRELVKLRDVFMADPATAQLLTA